MSPRAARQAPTRSVVMTPLDDVVPATRNPKRHDLDRIRLSLRVHGYADTVLHDGRTGRLVSGHGRVEALAAMHADGETPPDGIAVLPDGQWAVPVTHGWASTSDAQAEAYLVAANRTTELGGWDDADLSNLLDSLRGAEADTDLLAAAGYTDDELAALVAKVAADEPQPEQITDPDVAPPPPADPVSKLGDVWTLGPHRLVVGDSTDPEVVALAVNGRAADLLVTDPPYGIAYVGKTADALTIDNDKLTGEALRSFLIALFRSARASLRPGGSFYVFAPAEGSANTQFYLSLEAAALPLRWQLTWVKDRFVIGRADYHLQHESVLYGWREDAAHTWVSDRKQSSVWNFARPARNAEHPTMKPVAMLEYAISNNTHPGDLVLDVCGGSGSTLIAAHAVKRVCAMVELDPRYADVICRRWQQVYGSPPVRDGVPVSFEPATTS